MGNLYFWNAREVQHPKNHTDEIVKVTGRTTASHPRTCENLMHNMNLTAVIKDVDMQT